MAHVWAIWSSNFKIRGGRRQKETKGDSAAEDRAICSSASLLSFGNSHLIPAGHSAPRTHLLLSVSGSLRGSPNVVSAHPDLCSWTTDCTWVPVGKVGHALLCTTEAFLITATPSSLEKSRSGDAQFLRDLPLRWYSSLDSLMLSERWAQVTELSSVVLLSDSHSTQQMPFVT